ncbi:redoxin domain-containing protein [uncultured Marinobacter sp.]|uniref:peroxiredoxin family protein n=1 Tax=uncultured Marinobacter sp. TaxID=187379 RepID=UPI002626888C|nr:redoxin domain-containing protein [uncultured Marinobacter sp.]
MLGTGVIAPELTVASWLNTNEPLQLEKLRGQVVVLHAFQMLCPGCVTHGLPQAAAIHEMYRSDEVQVIGLHSVFEHHHVMTPDALKVFIHEYRLKFPIAIDLPSETGPVPVMMQKLNLQGTPSLVLIDKDGTIRFTQLGRVSDMQVGYMIGRLLA